MSLYSSVTVNKEHPKPALTGYERTLGTLFYKVSAHVIWACWIWDSLHLTLYTFLSCIYHYPSPNMWGHMGSHSHLYTPVQGSVTMMSSL